MKAVAGMPHVQFWARSIFLLSAPTMSEFTHLAACADADDNVLADSPALTSETNLLRHTFRKIEPVTVAVLL